MEIWDVPVHQLKDSWAGPLNEALMEIEKLQMKNDTKMLGRWLYKGMMDGQQDVLHAIFDGGFDLKKQMYYING